MGMCKPSGGISSKIGRIGNLDTIETPNTRIDLYDKDGNLIQQRWYGPDGKAIWNRDWKHSEKGGEHKFPHDHSWDWTNPQHPDRPPYQGPKKTDSSYC